MQLTAKMIVDWLRKSIGEGFPLNGNDFVIEHDWMGDTLSGFYSEYEINYEALEKEMDEWIKATYMLREQPPA